MGPTFHGDISMDLVPLAGRTPAPRLTGGDVLAVPATGRGADRPGAETMPGGTAVSLNVTVTNPAANGLLIVWPCGRPMPLASNLNFVAGQTVAVAVLATIGADGNICLTSNVDTDVVVDLFGWFDGSSPYRPATPERVADTRNGDEDEIANLLANDPLPVDVTLGGVPA